MAAWSSICWENDLWAAVSAAPCPAPPAGGKTPNPRPPHGGAAGRSPQGGTVPLSPGAGAFEGGGYNPAALFCPRATEKTGACGGRDQPKEDHGTGTGTGTGPHPAAGRRGGPAGGRSCKAQAGHGRRPGRQPHAQAAAASDRATATTAERPRRGGVAPRFSGGQQRDRTQADHGPGAPPPAASQHQRRRGPTGRGRTRPGRCDLAAYLLCLPQRGKRRRRGESPEPGRRGGGPCARRPGGTGGGRYGQKQGPSLPVVGRRRRAKINIPRRSRGACPPGWTRLDEKKMRGGRFVPPACRYSGYQISPCSA